jgi:hypothetical protein
MERLVPPRFFWIVGVLAWFAVVGVVIPLAFLYAGAHSTLKWLLLAGFALGILGLVGVIGILLAELQASGRLDIPRRDQLWR